MKISYNWLKRYAQFDLDAEKMARLLTGCGLEVESYERFEMVRGNLKGVVVGEVIACEKHPNADKLSLAKVDIGRGEILSVVCGAPNVAVGQKVPLATVGTVLYSGDKPFEIKEARIRGELSQGMICAEDELGLGTSHDGIMVLDPVTPVGTPAASYFRLEEDVVFEIGLTPNRTDATSHIGVARDAIAARNQAESRTDRLEWPPVEAFSIDDHTLEIPVEVADPKLCTRYSGLVMTGVSIGPSPSWLANLLTAAGIRPINNIVDITNFVLMEVGQPLHAFDADAIAGGKVIVRRAKSGEKFVTLDEIERNLSEDDLMICNAREPMCIAGVFGGARSGVTGSTRNIFLESACFNPRSIRKTSRFHGLQTDASFRFERGSDPEITVWALKRAALLIRELAGGKISSGIVDVFPVSVKPTTVIVSFSHIDRLVGETIPKENIRQIISDLGMEISAEDDRQLHVIVPAFKVDVTREADTIEEILRIYGYDRIRMPHRLRTSLSFPDKPDAEAIRDMVSDMLSAQGFTEIMNNSLTRARYAEQSPWLDPQQSVPLLNPLSSDLNVMRQSLLWGGLETVVFNQNRKISDLKLYEFGRVYRKSGEKAKPDRPLEPYSEHEMLAVWMTGRREEDSWRKNDAKSDLFDLKATVHGILVRLGVSPEQLEPGDAPAGLFSDGLAYRSGKTGLVHFGMVDARVLKSFDLKQEVFYAAFEWESILQQLAGSKVEYHEIPRFPEVRRDLALIIDRSVRFEDLKKAAFQAENRLLKSVGLFDIYEDDRIGRDKKSYAMSFILQDEEKTLTDEVIERTMSKILRTFQEKFHAALR